jgi:hypothetical protein
MNALPYALGCPSCVFYVEVSEVDPDASMGELYNHVFWEHAPHDRDKTHRLLAKARELTAAEVAR